MHYIITKGGVARNIVPDLAQMDLVARNPSNTVLGDFWGRMLKICQGAALMTGTTVEVTDIRGEANIIGNDALAPVAQKNLEEVGGFTMSETEKAFAVELQKTLSIDTVPGLDETHLNIIVIQVLLAFTSNPEKAPGNPDSLELKSCKPRFFQAAVCCAIGCTSRRRPVSTSKIRPKIRPRTGTSFARVLMSGQARFNASGTGGRCSPSPSQPYGTRARSLRGFWDRP